MNKNSHSHKQFLNGKKKEFLFLKPFQFPKSEKKILLLKKKNKKIKSVLELLDKKESAKVI